jgi:hypothetical protein
MGRPNDYCDHRYNICSGRFIMFHKREKNRGLQAEAFEEGLGSTLKQQF